MKKIRYVLLAFAMALLAAGLFAPQSLAAEITTEQVVNCQNLVNGVAVMDNGSICAVSGSGIKGFNAEGATIFSVTLPAKCGNLCAYGDYLFAAGYTSGHMNEIYVLKPGEWTSCKTLDAGQRAQAVAVDYNGYLYCVNSTGKRANGKKATKILQAKISDIISLSSGSTINWTKEYQPDYDPPSSDSDGNCYPQGIAVDGRGNIYIADKGSSNGYDASVDGIYKYSPASDRVSAMYFTAGSSHLLFTWIYDICADDYGTVAVVGRNNHEIAVFEPESTVADAIIKGNGYPEGVGMDKAGNIYFNASNNGTAAKNGIYRINMGHVAVTGVNLSVNSKTVYVGKSFTLSAEVSPSNATNKDVMYSSSDTSVASVDASGKVTGKKKGQATITVKSVQGRKIASCAVTVENNTADTPVAKNCTYTGKEQTGVVAGTGFTLSGTTKAIKAGTYNATATLKDGYEWSNGTTAPKTVTWKINAKSIKPTVTLSTTTYTYNGKVKGPAVTVKYDSKELTKGTDYTVTVPTGRVNAGTYTYTVKCKGNYTGTNTAAFTINPKAITPTVILSTTSYTYNGIVKKPAVTVKGDGQTFASKITASNAKVAVSYASGRKNVGKYAVKAVLKGNYSGNKTVYFKINPKGTTMSKVTAVSKGFTAAWTKQATQTTGYQIQYSLSSTFASGNKTALITKNTILSKKITGLTAKKKYYVRVRTYKTVGSTKYYSAWSKALAVTTKA